MENAFPKDISDSIRTCILSIFWKKDDIIEFLKNNSCTVSDLKDAENTSELSRSKIVDVVFSKLHSRNDGGLGQFRSMLKSLIDWKTFDPYYFDILKKLDKETAQRNINHLKQLQEIRDAKLSEEKRKREEKTELLKKKNNKEKIQKIFFQLFQGKDENDKLIGNQKRGYLLEEFLKELFMQEELLNFHPFSFNIEGEQIDGTLKFEGENYIIEAKWHDKEVASNALYQFSYKVEGKMHGRGIFISINGFSDDSVRALKNGKALRTILVDGADLTMIVEGFTTFREILDKKIFAAQTQGKIYYDIFSEKSKIQE
jgi:hypothetical protein